MQRAHIAFISAPSAAHVNPALPIISTLVRRGHRVTCTTSERFSSRIAATGAECLPPCSWDSSDSLCHYAVRTLAKISSFYEENRPSLIIYDFVALAGLLLATRSQIPAIQISPHFAFNEMNLDQQIPNPIYRNQVLELGSYASQFLRHYGINVRQYIFHREKLNIQFVPKELDPNQIADTTCFYAGRCAGEQIGFGEWSRHGRDNKPIALVATSTTTVQGGGYFRMCIDALADLPWQVILSVGDEADPASFLPLPPNFEIVQKTSHTRILPYAGLLVFLGGLLTTTESAYHGVPMVVTSCGNLELETLGDNLVRLGLGIHLREPEMNADSLRKCACDVFESDVILHNVRKLQHSIRRQAGAEETANRIEEYLESHMA